MDSQAKQTAIPESDTDKLINILGLTNNINEAGFILPDGRLLHLDRTNSYKRKNHLDVLKLLPSFSDRKHTIIDTDMIAFMAKEKLVRFCVEGKIHTAIKPTSIQLRKIYTTLAYRSNPFEIILSNPAGMTLSQHKVSGPSMGALVNIYKEYEDAVEELLCEDEFCLEEDEKYFRLIFRPSLKEVGKMNKKTQMIKMDPQYKDATKLFLKLVRQVQK
jgi:hypothetical protein